jgi:hypothetical protein
MVRMSDIIVRYQSKIKAVVSTTGPQKNCAIRVMRGFAQPRTDQPSPGLRIRGYSEISAIDCKTCDATAKT